MLAVSIVYQGLDKRLALIVLNITRNKTWRIVVGFMFLSAILSSFIGEHTVAAMMLPVALSLIKNAGMNKIRASSNLSTILLFSIAYGAAIGSVGTPSGGGRNAIMIGYLSGVWARTSYPI